MKRARMGNGTAKARGSGGGGNPDTQPALRPLPKQQRPRAPRRKCVHTTKTKWGQGESHLVAPEVWLHCPACYHAMSEGRLSVAHRRPATTEEAAARVEAFVAAHTLKTEDPSAVAAAFMSQPVGWGLRVWRGRLCVTALLCASPPPLPHSCRCLMRCSSKSTKCWRL